VWWQLRGWKVSTFVGSARAYLSIVSVAAFSSVRTETRAILSKSLLVRLYVQKSQLTERPLSTFHTVGSNARHVAEERFGRPYVVCVTESQNKVGTVAASHAQCDDARFVIVKPCAVLHAHISWPSFHYTD
jgi:hypothetical protein